jgi:hypothetical protein
VRLYRPDTGRFLLRDPVAGGSATSYDYANVGPATGNWSKAGEMALTAAANLVGCGAVEDGRPEPGCR